VVLASLPPCDCAGFLRGRCPGCDSRSTEVVNGADRIPAIASCLKKDQEAILLAHNVVCNDYRNGDAFFTEEVHDAPFDFKTGECDTDLSGQVNARHLDSDAIQQLGHDKSIGSRGIRIIGAIFCKRLELIRLTLPFSLVLDRAVFAKGIELRNIDIRGDLSFDGVLLLNWFQIIRSRIRGSLFSDNTFIDRLSVADTKIDNSASFAESVLFDSTQFHNVSVAKELSVRGSALSYFITQFSTIGEILDLSHSQARCAYHLNKSTIGYLIAKRTGFGTIAPPGPGGPASLGYYVWNDDLSERVKKIISSPSPEIQNRVSKSDSCINQSKKSYRAEFFIFDNNIKSSFCLSEFRWLAPRDTGPYTPPDFFGPRQGSYDYLRSIVAINGNTIGNNLIVNLWPNHDLKTTIDHLVAQQLHKFEVVGVKAGGLIINFANINQNHITAVDGLQFERLYSAHASCKYGGSESAPPIYDDRTLSIIVNLAEPLKLPRLRMP
jgi:hypothetical protein